MDYIPTFMTPSALQWLNFQRGSRPTPPLTPCTLTKKLEAGQLTHTHLYAPSTNIYREKHRCYPALAGRVAALEEEGLASTDPVSGKDSESEVEGVDGLSVCLTQVMSRYQREERKCFMCGSPGHFARDCPHCNAFK